MKHSRMIPSLILFMFIIGGVSIYAAVTLKERTREKPEDLLAEYMAHIEEQEYDAMYAMIHTEDPHAPEKKSYIERNSKIYGGIEVKGLKLEDITAGEKESGRVSVSYRTSFDTIAGNVAFENNAVFVETEDGYRLSWQDSLIFPELTGSDRVQVSESQAERGRILDRDGQVLAGKGTASSVGVIPGKLTEREAAYGQLAELLGLDAETVRARAEVGWAREDSFVPIGTIPKVEEIDLLSLQPDETLLREYERQERLMEIPGVMLSDVGIRSYSLGPAASHLIGYVQEVTAEDLEAHPGEGYSPGNMIGKSGVEGVFEKRLKGKDGCEISIVDKNGDLKKVIACIPKEDGEDIRLTIDRDLQVSLYERFKEDRGCSVAMDPYTGEVLALVSTPSYDNNDLIKGMSEEKWTALNEDGRKPLYDRFRQVWCPGSTFKPVIAGIGLKTGLLDPDEDFGSEGLSWQKDPSWGSYQVTTLQDYSPAVLENALIYSDNIYFAKAALKIGADPLMEALDALGFGRELPFEIGLWESQYSNTDRIETEIQLADSGYGQGQILVNPLHLASIYTAFLNDGNMIQPYLQYRENAPGQVWIQGAFTADQAREILEGVKAVVNDPNGTGYAAHREDLVLAGKTGTAELKATREDTDGTEIGWFAVFTAERDKGKQILLISMVEDVKNIGGSGYVVAKDREVLDGYINDP